MDVELTAAGAHIKLARLSLEQRLKRLENATSKMSRHYNRIQHTSALLSLIQELEGVVMQDPDNWDDEPDIVPF